MRVYAAKQCSPDGGARSNLDVGVIEHHIGGNCSLPHAPWPYTTRITEPHHKTSKMLYTGPSANRWPVPTAIMRLIQSYFEALVSNIGFMRK